MFETDAMTTAGARRRFRSSRMVRLTSAIAAMAWLAAPTISRAGPETDYVLSNVSADFNGTPVSIRGSFTSDGSNEWLAFIQVTGPFPYGGEYSYDYFSFGPPTILTPLSPLAGSGVNAGGLQISFGNILPSGARPVASVVINGVTGTNPTGDAVTTGMASDYHFLNASTVLNGKTESIDGFFTFDPLTDVEYFAQIALVNQSGHTDLSCFFDAEPVGIGTVAEADCGRGFIQFDFANKLASAPDLLREVDLDGFAGISVDNAPTGVAYPSGVPLGTCLAAVPEPPTLSTLGPALGTLLLGRWAVRRAGQPATDQPSGMSSTA